VTDPTPTTDWPADEPHIGWEQYARNWLEGARHFSQNADYWRDRAEKAEAEVRALRDQRDTAVAEAAERLITRLMEDYAWDTDDVREIHAARDALLAAVDRPPTGTPDTGDDDG
jgi:hypothetical protein